MRHTGEHEKVGLKDVGVQVARAQAVLALALAWCHLALAPPLAGRVRPPYNARHVSHRRTWHVARGVRRDLATIHSRVISV